MKTSIEVKIAYAVASIAISVGIIYSMGQPLNQKAKSTIKAHLESPSHGPLDEAMANMAGMEDVLAKKPKWKPVLPQAPEFDFEFKNESFIK